MKPRFQNASVKKIFDAYPAKIRARLLAVRELIFEVAAELEEIGDVEETLKWGEPAYLPKRAKVGTTIRIHAKKSNPGQYAVYFNCKTNLVATFKTIFAKTLVYEGHRAIVFDENDTLPVQELKYCIAAAFTYFSSKQTR